MEISKSDYENIRAALKSIVSCKIFNDKYDDLQKEKLLDLIIFFDNNGYTFFTQLDLSNAIKDNLLEDLILMAQKIVKESVYGLTEGELIDVIEKYIRFYNIILLRLDDNEKLRLIQIKFDIQKRYIDKKIKEFESLVEGKKNDVENLSSSFSYKINEKDKNLEEKFNNVENIENSFIGLWKKINKSQDDFEKELNDKQEEFCKKLVDESNAFQNDIIDRLNDIDDNVHRKELAGYFLAEKEKLKGEVNTESLFSLFIVLIMIIICLSFSTAIIDFAKGIFDSENWKNLVPFLLCVCVLILLYVVKAFCLFRNNKNDTIKFWLCTPYWGWLGATVLGMCLIFGISANIYLHCKVVDYKELIHRLPLFMILVWYTWFCAKQFSYYKQICDEYEYKYLLSMSYLSYRNEANVLKGITGDGALLVTLLDSVIKNISRSPVQSIKSDCYTPLAEMANALKLTFGKQNTNNNP